MSPNGMPSAVMIFAAGLGRRMGPLTAQRPKPMVEVGGRPLIDHALDLTAPLMPLRRVVNLHHKGEVLRDLLPGSGGHCPACAGEMHASGMVCPECSHREQAAYCGGCETYVAACPTCGLGTQIGATCVGCGEDLAGLTCGKCNHTGPVRFWASG